jgi:uncharacterized membrane protein
MDVLLSIVAFFLAAALMTLIWAHFRLRRRVSEQEERFAELTQRVYRLETSELAEAVPEAKGTETATTLLPVVVASPDLANEEPTPRRETEDWEAVVGGNWLNRVGALVLVIGIALLLGYSLTRLGPLGKVAISFVAGLSMLAGGIALRSSERYGTFATSLVGAGWALIYFTAYAAHALEPARVITSAAVGSLLLLAVSAGMILHALSYTSERGTALAFVFSFISLNVTSLTAFSVYASMLLAGSILTLAFFRHWFHLAVTGVILAYATFILRLDAVEPLAQWALWAQWIAFESFDILDVRRRGLKRGISRSIFLLNACGFIGASMLYGWHDEWWFLFASAIAYLVSTVLRARIAPAAGDDARFRVLGGGYEGALTASAALMTLALVDRLAGTNIAIALLTEGEMIVLAGHALKSRFTIGLGAGVLSLAFLRLTLFDALEGGPVRVWTPAALLMAGMFMANRIRGGWGYTAGAAVLLAMATGAEFRREWIPFAWGGLGTGALMLALARGMKDLRAQHLVWALAVFTAGLIVDGPGSVLPLALTVLCFYTWQFLVRDKDIEQPSVPYAGSAYSLLGTILLTVLLFREVQGRLLTVALGIEGAVLLIAGLVASERILRLTGLALFLLCIGKAFAYDLRHLDTFSRIVSFIVLGLLLLGASWVYTRFRERIKRLL